MLLGVGGAGLLTGTITGIVAISKKNGLECPDHQCPPSQYDKLDSARTFSTISTIGFGVGIAGAAAGTVLLLVGKSEPEAQVGSVRARPLIGDRWLGVTGEF